MQTVKHTCYNCESEFIIKYDVDSCEDDPQYCPFCAERMIEIDSEEEDDE